MKYYFVCCLVEHSGRPERNYHYNELITVHPFEHMAEWKEHYRAYREYEPSRTLTLINWKQIEAEEYQAYKDLFDE
jgi:hypothetical protein